MINFTPNSLEKKNNLDNVVTYIVLKKLMAPVEKTDAYILGIVDYTGRKIKEPVTKEEMYSYTTFDKFIFRLKRELGSKLNKFNNFLYVKVFDDDFSKQLNVTSSLSKKGVVQKIKKDVNSRLESENINFDTLLKEMLYDYLNEKE